ncbi:MAG: N-6 DNA methylase [Phycisphaerales bacterium]
MKRPVKPLRPTGRLVAHADTTSEELFKRPSRSIDVEGTYRAFYDALGRLRGEFHRIGRFDDANAKLDELCKLLVLRTLDARHPDPTAGSRLSLDYLKRVAKAKCGSDLRIAAALHAVHDELCESFASETSTFGTRRGLNLPIDDDEFATAVIPLLQALPADSCPPGDAWRFDGLNEAFGHFIQDSFRNRKEDAQYMTPPEVVSAMVQMAFSDMMRDEELLSREDPWLIGDPTCGVGSFLAAAYRHCCGTHRGGASMAPRLKLFGQDKVDRMARLAIANLRIFARADADIRTANSIIPPATLDEFANRFDLVLTNPPFGAAFQTMELLSRCRPSHLPALFELARTGAIPKAIDSEYILLDRELALLRPGGRLMMVVPDHVVSGGGFSEDFRLEITKRFELIAVLDLPTETFAQAGTRTKTSVIYLRRPARSSRRIQSRVFMATASDIGFRVVSRAGSTVKRLGGANELEPIVRAYESISSAKDHSPAKVHCVSESPSIAAVPRNGLINNRWTASFYRSARLNALRKLEKGPLRASLLPLNEAVELDPDGQERVSADAKNRCISVLHVREDGSIDLGAVHRYRPTTTCVRCRAGDVLLSKINPRITRVAVIPDTGFHLGCSAEFAVLRPRGGTVSAWSLALLLRSRPVQDQILTLTSGTSSSHNRIKDRDLETVMIPVPAPGSPDAKKLKALGERYRRAIERQYTAQDEVEKCFAELDDFCD